MFSTKEKYRICPNPSCGNTKDNSQVIECDKCGFKGCYVSNGFFSNPQGCYPNSCPNCGSSSYTTIGRIDN
jgi:hypothetical protein